MNLSSVFLLFIANRMVSAHAFDFGSAAIQSLLGYGGSQTKIVGGTNVAKGRYEYLALTAGPQLCGATLIHNDILLTAGHCSAFFEDGVLMGGVELDGSDGQLHQVDYVFMHEEYPGSGPEPHDIALVKLSSPSSVEPVLLATDTDFPIEGTTLTAMGWGSTSEGGPLADLLLETNLDASDFTFCNGLYGDLIEELMFCSLSEPGTTRDTCQGDSGGPLINDSGVQVGIVSFGSGCARKDTPSVNTRVSGYRQWITDGICDHSDFPPLSCTTAMPSLSPTVESTSASLTYPSETPTQSPTVVPTPLPSTKPTSVPTYTPSLVPTSHPTMIPSASPSVSPVTMATISPTMVPSAVPTSIPTPSPTALPTLATPAPSELQEQPSATPTQGPAAFTSTPSVSPIQSPTKAPVLMTKSPSLPPTGAPVSPTSAPVGSPTNNFPAPTLTPTPTPPKCTWEGRGSFFRRWIRYLWCIYRALRASN